MLHLHLLLLVCCCSYSYCCWNGRFAEVEETWRRKLWTSFNSNFRSKCSQKNRSNQILKWKPRIKKTSTTTTVCLFTFFTAFSDERDLITIVRHVQETMGRIIWLLFFNMFCAQKKQQVWSSDFCVSHKEFSFFVKKIIKRSCLSSFEINHSLTNVEKLRTASVVVFLFIIKTKLIFILQKTFKNLWHSNHFLSFKKIKRRCVEINYIWAPFSFTWSLFGLENILTEGFFHKKWNCFDVQSLTHISTFSIEKST